MYTRRQKKKVLEKTSSYKKEIRNKSHKKKYNYMHVQICTCVLCWLQRSTKAIESCGIWAHLILCVRQVIACDIVFARNISISCFNSS